MTKQIRLKDQNNDDLIIQQGESMDIVATFADVSSTPATLTKDQVVSLTVTLYTGTTILNSRDGQDVKDANNGTMATDGTLTLALGPSDAAIVSAAAGATETHIARFTWTWNDGAVRTGICEYTFEVEALASPS